MNTLQVRKAAQIVSAHRWNMKSIRTTAGGTRIATCQCGIDVYMTSNEQLDSAFTGHQMAVLAVNGYLAEPIPHRRHSDKPAEETPDIYVAQAKVLSAVADQMYRACKTQPTRTMRMVDVACHLRATADRLTRKATVTAAHASQAARAEAHAA